MTESVQPVNHQRVVPTYIFIMQFVFMLELVLMMVVANNDDLFSYELTLIGLGVITFVPLAVSIGVFYNALLDNPDQLRTLKCVYSLSIAAYIGGGCWIGSLTDDVAIINGLSLMLVIMLVLTMIMALMHSPRHNKQHSYYLAKSTKS